LNKLSLNLCHSPLAFRVRRGSGLAVLMMRGS
jgi:hypothetical protein